MGAEIFDQKIFPAKYARNGIVDKAHDRARRAYKAEDSSQARGYRRRAGLRGSNRKNSSVVMAIASSRETSSSTLCTNLEIASTVSAAHSRSMRGASLWTV
jgi:hypothetical protein